MDDLLEKITSKTGIPVDKAKDVLETVAEFLKDKLPGPMGDQVAKLLDGDDGDGGNGDGDDLLGKAKDALGGFLGND